MLIDELSFERVRSFVFSQRTPALNVEGIVYLSGEFIGSDHFRNFVEFPPQGIREVYRVISEYSGRDNLSISEESALRDARVFSGYIDTFIQDNRNEPIGFFGTSDRFIIEQELPFLLEALADKFPNLTIRDLEKLLALEMMQVASDSLGSNVFGYIAAVQDVIESLPVDCFAEGTPITLFDGSTKPIEAVKAGDIVLSYNGVGELVQGRVKRTFVKEVEHLLDVFGLRVTPGHVTLCGDGPFVGQHVPIIDILRTDGALVRQNGGMVRAATGAEVGTEADQMVLVVVGKDQSDGFKETTRRRLRSGTRLLLESGHDISVLDLIYAAGGTLSSSGLVKTKDGMELPFLWPFPGGLPNCEDYVLRRSERTLAEIYARPEWEGIGPRLPSPSRLI